MAVDSNAKIFTQEHAWLAPYADQEYVLGITEFAQDQLGDIVFVDLPDIGQKTQAGESCLVVESVKSASDVICPINGEITQVNQLLTDEPELINESPYDKGWIVRIRVNNNEVIESKMTQDEYNAHVSKSTD